MTSDDNKDYDDDDDDDDDDDYDDDSDDDDDDVDDDDERSGSNDHGEPDYTALNLFKFLISTHFHSLPIILFLPVCVDRSTYSIYAKERHELSFFFFLFLFFFLSFSFLSFLISFFFSFEQV